MIDFSEIKYVELSTICKTITGPIQDSKSYEYPGIYPIYSSGTIGVIDSYDYDCESIIINKFLNSENRLVNYENSKHSVNNTVFQICSNNSSYSTKYIYYFLMANIQSLSKLYVGSVIKTLTLSSFLKLKIPFPSTNHQKKIVQFMDDLYADKFFGYEKLINLYSSDEIFSSFIDKKFEFFIDYLILLNKNIFENRKLLGFHEDKDLDAYSMFSMKVENLPLEKICTMRIGCNVSDKVIEDTKTDSNIGIFDLKTYFDKKITNYCSLNEKKSKYFVRKGDLLISLKGEIAGQIIKYEFEEESFFTSDFAKVFFDMEIIDSEYFYFWYKNKRINNKLTLINEKGFNIISFRQLKKIQFPNFKYEIQEHILKKHENDEKLIKDTESSIKSDFELRETMLIDYVKSNFVVNYCLKTFEEFVNKNCENTI